METAKTRRKHVKSGLFPALISETGSQKPASTANPLFLLTSHGAGAGRLPRRARDRRAGSRRGRNRRHPAAGFLGGLQIRLGAVRERCCRRVPLMHEHRRPNNSCRLPLEGGGPNAMGLARPARNLHPIRGRAKRLAFGVGVNMASSPPVTPTRNAALPKARKYWDLARPCKCCTAVAGRSKSVALRPPPSRRLRRLGGGAARAAAAKKAAT